MKCFKCYSCEEQCDTLTEIVTHCKIFHGEVALKYRELKLDEVSGKYGYITKSYPDIIPRQIRASQLKLVVKDNIVILTAENSPQFSIKTPLKGAAVENIPSAAVDNKERPKYKCVYCKQSFSLLDNIIDHCSEQHNSNILKYQELTQNPSTSKFGYISKLHEGIIPEAIRQSGKELVVKDNIVVIREKTSCRRNITTPVKLASNSGEMTEIDYVSDDNHSSMNQEEALKELQCLLPKVINALFECGKLDSYIKFNRLIYDNNLPMNNICFLLFTDLVEWFSCSTTSRMRYQKETVQFWQLGYRLFHGKFLRFMSGLRNYGQVLDNEADLGDLDPVDSLINFAVPSKQNLYRKDEKAEPIYPGVCFDQIKTLSQVLSDRPLKLCVDGKKISRGKGKEMGDIDCWGYESKPTLKEKKSKSKEHSADLQTLVMKIDCMMENGIMDLHQLTLSDKSDLRDKLVHEIQNIAEHNKLLREKATSLEHIENKLKKMGGKNWMTCRYYPAICSVRVSRSSMLSHIEEGIVLTNKLAFYAATLNGKQSLFQIGDNVVIQEQTNYYQLNQNYETENPKFIKQRTDKWMGIRNEALVTGSTCNKALGLGKLKEQQTHYDAVILKTVKREFSKEVQERMEYGVQHEEDAVLTVCSKVLPSMYPDMNMFEEGRIPLAYNNLDTFMVVSPDGSLRENKDSSTKIAYENKCKAPTSYSRNAYYVIPLYYIPQVLSEINACGAEKLLFTCWSENSMTVFEVTNDKEFWEKCWGELTTVYASEKRCRPKHFSQTSKELRADVRQFRETHTKLIGEFPAARAIKPSANNQELIDVTKPYITHANKFERADKSVELAVVQDTTEVIRKWMKDAYEHLRSTASEILVFMVSNLDRIYDMEMENAHIVAYALKGPSMKNDVLRKMMQEVIEECEKQGLNISVTSSDGQWHLYGVLDDEQKPLSVHQLQRKLWGNLRSMDKAKLQSMLKNICLVKSLEDVHYEKKKGLLSVIGHRRDKLIRLSVVEHDQNITDETEDTNKDKDSTDRDPNHDSSSEYYGCITGEFEQMVGPDTVDVIDRAFDYEQMTEINDSDKYPISKEHLYGESTPVLLDLDNQSKSDLCDISEIFVHDFEWLQRQQRDEILQEQLLDEVMYSNSEHELNVSQSVQKQHTSTVIGEASKLLNIDEWGMYDQYLQVSDFATDVQSIYGAAGEETATDVDLLGHDVTPVVRGALELSNNYDNGMTGDANQLPSYGTEMDEGIASNEDCQMESVAGPQNQSLIKILSADVFASMLHDLQHDSKSMAIRNWLDIAVEKFVELCSTKESINKHFQKREVYICVKSVEREYGLPGQKVLSNWPKYRLLEVLFNTEHDSSNQSSSNPTKRRKINCTSLKDLCWKQINHMTKNQLMVLFAEHQWQEEFDKWKSDSPIPYGVSITEVKADIQWFSQPRVETDGKVRFHFTDACHLLTCLRTKLCTTGIVGLETKAWEIAALSKDTKLNITVVVDCVDKQDVALARRVFAEDVENVMSANGYTKEARFCRLIRKWFDAEDEPAISAVERCRRRVELLDWLLDGYRIGKFPPPTRYVKGIPIVTFEAMVCHLERKLQLLAFVPNSMYNVRACGTQEVEQLFSSFRDMDPTGTGTVKPDVIPGMLASAIEIDKFRMNPNKPFYIRTSSASVYPSRSSLSPDGTTTDLCKAFIRTAGDAKINIHRIVPSDHAFDSKTRDKRSHRRASGLISQPGVPAHGERGVRQYHRRDDSKIPAHRRLGFMDYQIFDS